jgi:HrpA-like RNA helicase
VSEVLLEQNQEQDDKYFWEVMGDLPEIKWPDQYEQKPDGSLVLVPAEGNYKLGNPNTVVAPHRERFLEALENNSAVIARSPTGTGKTTELTLYAMESGRYSRILVTQPRVVAARSTAQYIRSQLAPVLGEDLAKQTIGWHTAPDSDYDDVTNLMTIVTDGVPVQQLISSQGFGGDRTLMVIDEVHEDKTNMHFLMMLAKRYGIDVLLMSATVDVDEKAAYFADKNGVPAPIIDIEGRTYPIVERDYTLKQPMKNGRPVAPGGSISVPRPSKMNRENLEEEAKPVYRDGYMAAAEYARQGLDILLFVPDINDVHRAIARLRDRVPQGYTILGLHGDQTGDEQQLALASYPGGKIIVATDVAMTSLTPNVDVVLDSGMSRTIRLNNGDGSLEVLPSSRAARDQRKGRCGRTKPGIYELVHLAGYPVPLSLDEIDEYDMPEILCKRPDEVLMKLGKIGLNSCEELLAAPNAKETELALRRLRRLGAIGLTGYQLEKVGEQMVSMPLDAPSARMLAEAQSHYSEAVQLQMAASLAVQQVGGVHSRDLNSAQIRRLTNERDADMLVGLDIFIEAMKMSDDERREKGIVEQRFKRAKKAYAGLAERYLRVDPYDLTPPTDIERAQLHACMISGIDQVYRAHSKGQYADGVQKMRRKMKDSQLWTTPGELVAGTAYNIGRITQNNYSTARLVTNAFRVDVDSLREFVPERIEDRKTSKYRVDKSGNVQEQFAVYFDGRPLEKYYWQDANSSRSTREILLDHVLDEDFENTEDLPSSIQALRRQLGELRQLQHRTDRKLDIDRVVERMKAVIRQNMPVETASLANVPVFTVPQQFSEVTNEIRQEILSQSPDQVTLYNEMTQEFVEVPVVYINNAAYLTLSKDMYPLLASEIPELRGRKVMVRPLNGHRYVDQATAYEQRGSRRDNRGTIVADEEKRRRREERRVAMQDQPDTSIATSPMASRMIRNHLKRQRNTREHKDAANIVK